MAEEQYCYQALAELRKNYERDAKPEGCDGQRDTAAGPCGSG